VDDRITFRDSWRRLELSTSQPLFLGNDETVAGHTLKSASLDVASTVADLGWKTVGLHTRDSFSFVAGVLGITLAGAVPDVLPHTHPRFLSRLATDVDGLLTDYSAPPDSLIPARQISSLIGIRSRSDRIWPAFPWISFRTSGSEGMPKRIAKPLAVIEAELAAFEERFGAQVREILGGTVDHQHYYGATVRIFWPLLAGRKIWRPLMRYPSDVMNAAPRSMSIVSSPTFLVEAQDLIDQSDLADAGIRMFSAGAPLPLDTARRLNGQDHWLVAEIFGSTESGAICSRVRRRAEYDDAWTPLPGLEVSVDDQRIRVDWQTCGDDGRAVLGDHGEWLADGRLRLIGRRDRIVKVREKRVSLIDVEDALASHPFVWETAALALERHRLTELGVVAALSDQGFESLAAEGHRGLAVRLQDHLRATFDPTTLPKKWRFVRALPRNGMSKVTQEALRELFADRAGEEGTDKFPKILSDVGDADSRVIDFQLGTGLHWFKGHFPEIPVLPGVVQIDWAAHFGAALIKRAGPFQQLQRVKFNNVMQPGMHARLTLRYDEEKRSLSFLFFNDEQTFSSGRFVYG